MVLETLAFFSLNHQTRLVAREDFIMPHVLASQPLLFPSILTHPLINSRYHPSDPAVALKRASLFPLSVSLSHPLAWLCPTPFNHQLTLSPDRHPFLYHLAKFHLFQPIHIFPGNVSRAAYTLLWWWRWYALLKCLSASVRLHGAISQNAVIFILTSVRTWTLTEFKFKFGSIFWFS
jgi:hypothetical protein